MLSPEYLWSIADSVVNIYDEMNNWAIRDIAERIMSAELYDYDGLPGTARYRAWLLNQAGEHYDNMAKKVAEITKKSEEEIMKLFVDAALTAIENDFKPANKMPYDITQDRQASQILQAAYKQTNGELRNYTRTTLDRSNKLMIDTLDKAYFEVSTGMRSYSEVIKESIDTVAQTGCGVVYPKTGHVDSIEVAVRRAVMTGINQGTAKITLHNCEVMGSDYVIVYSHVGARYSETDKIANHMGWQGKVYKINGSDDYPNLEEETGFPSNPLGLCGYNCKHSFYAFMPELDNPDMYKHVVIDEEASKRQYDLWQKQRRMERGIRKSKHILMGQQAAIDNCKDEHTKFELQLEYDKRAYRLRHQNKIYNEFCMENDLQKEAERIKVAKWQREQTSQAVKGANRYKSAKNVKLGSKHSDIQSTIKKEYIGKFEKDNLNAVLNKYEESICSNKIENAYVFQNNGEIYKFSGDESGVNIYDIDFENAIITHNHPKSNGIVSFGHDDFLFLKQHQDIAELRAVNEEYVYTVKLLKKIDDVVYNDIYIGGFKYINRSNNTDVQHCAFLELMKRGYIEYARKKRRKD